VVSVIIIGYRCAMAHSWFICIRLWELVRCWELCLNGSRCVFGLRVPGIWVFVHLGDSKKVIRHYRNARLRIHGR
jgi:hypothetical protein